VNHFVALLEHCGSCTSILRFRFERRSKSIAPATGPATGAATAFVAALESPLLSGSGVGFVTTAFGLLVYASTEEDREVVAQCERSKWIPL
jgi:hypothetical protein